MTTIDVDFAPVSEAWGPYNHQQGLRLGQGLLPGHLGRVRDWYVHEFGGEDIFRKPDARTSCITNTFSGSFLVITVLKPKRLKCDRDQQTCWLYIISDDGLIGWIVDTWLEPYPP